MRQRGIDLALIALGGTRRHGCTDAVSMPRSPGPMPAGSPWPFGVQWVEADDAFNFSLYSRHATGVTLLCYTEEDPARPVFEFRFQHPAHKTGNVWHCRIPASELRGATLYAYRVEGPHEPERGQRFDPQKVLLDPYAPSVFFPPAFSRKACAQAGPTDGRAPLGRLPGKRTVALPTEAAPRSHLPGRHRLRTACQRIHRARELRGHRRRSAARLPA